jgi:hypothetical protein
MDLIGIYLFQCKAKAVTGGEYVAILLRQPLLYTRWNCRQDTNPESPGFQLRAHQ